MKKFLSLCLMLSLMGCAPLSEKDQKYQLEVYSGCMDFVKSKPDLDGRSGIEYYHKRCFEIASAKATKP